MVLRPSSDEGDGRRIVVAGTSLEPQTIARVWLPEQLPPGVIAYDKTLLLLLFPREGWEACR